MAEDTCVKRPLPDCGDSEQKGTSEGFCPDWDACMPFGGRLYSRDGCVQVEASATAPADGVYDRVVVQDGCITGVAGQEVASYQPRPCTETPCACGSSESSGSGEEVSQSAGNLIYRDAGGALLARLFLGSGSGVSLTGAGTQDDPLVASAAPQVLRPYVQAGNSGVSVEGAGTQESPCVVSHADGSAGEMLVNGFSFDRYGHLQGYTPPSSAGTVNGVLSRNGVLATTDAETGIVTVELAPAVTDASGTYRLGGFDVTVDGYGRVQQSEQVVDIEAGARYMGAQLVTLTDSGSIADVVDTTADRLVVYHKASTRFTGSSASITFSTALVGSFRITLRAASVTSASFSVDGTAVTTDHGSDWACALTGARYSLGQHTVSASGTFSGPGYLDVEIVTGY